MDLGLIAKPRNLVQLRDATPRAQKVKRNARTGRRVTAIGGKRTSEKFAKCRHCTRYVCVSLILLIIVLLIGTFFPYPIHASCVVKWKFAEACTPVMQKFRRQILEWSSSNDCGPRGSKCLYALKEPRPSDGNVIRAAHLSPYTNSAERLSIVFEPVNGTCLATGESASEDWLVVFDYGVSYCNLRDLVVGAGFVDGPRFSELTADAICTQYNMAVCGSVG